MTAIKTFFYHIYFSMALITEPEVSFWERIKAFFLWIFALGPFVFISDTVTEWYLTNEGFFYSAICFITINMIFGASAHKRAHTFNWPTFLKRTRKMIWVLVLTYFTLEVLISTAGNNIVVENFRIILQITTLLYPGGKILKNVFILSRGQHPPKWIMERVFDFQKTGDLNKLFSEKPSKKSSL